MNGAPDSLAPHEEKRQLLKIAGSGGALFLPWLDPPRLILVATVATLGALLFLPRRGRDLYRPADEALGVPLGLVLYPATVLLSTVLFWSLGHDVRVVAALWGILGVGDGLATLVGTRLRSPRPLKWNPHKTLEGTIAYFAGGAAAAGFLTEWSMLAQGAVLTPAALVQVWSLAVIVAGLCAVLESLPVRRLDDNFWVPLAGGVVLHTAYLLRISAMEANAPSTVAFGVAGAVHLLLVAVLHWRRVLHPSGTLAAVALGGAMLYFDGVAGYVLLIGAFALTHGVSSYHLRWRISMGRADERAVVRWRARYLLAAGSVAVFMAFLAFATAVRPPDAQAAMEGLHGLFRTGMVGALAGTIAATVGRELGPVFGRRPVLATTFRRVPTGTTGAVSLQGSALGAAAALALSLAAALMGVVPGRVTPLTTLAGALGSHAESFVAASVGEERRPHPLVIHLLNTAGAALGAMLLVRVVG